LQQKVTRYQSPGNQKNYWRLVTLKSAKPTRSPMKKFFLPFILCSLLFAMGSCSPASERASLPLHTPQKPQAVVLSISPSSAELTVGEEKIFTVSAKDKEGNIISVVPKWSVEGDIGEISKQGLFKATTKGQGVIKAFTDSLIANSLVVVKEKEKFKPFFVYSEWTSKDDHFIPSGWMGDYGDITLDKNWQDNPHSGETCIKISGATKLTFWARGEKGGERIVEFKLGGIRGK